MMTNPYSDAYLDSKLLSASPLQLVHLAYEGVIEAVVEARLHLAAKRIQERSRAITRAQIILQELQISLDLTRGGTLSTQLASLYSYMQDRLREANFQQIEEPLAEVQKLLETVAEAWKEISATGSQAPEISVAATVASASPWMTASESSVYSRTDYTL